MSIVLELPAALEAALAGEANRLGLTLSDYAVQLLSRGHCSQPRTGAELLTYWQTEGLIGTRPEISDPAAHAQQVREQAQQRDRS